MQKMETKETISSVLSFTNITLKRFFLRQRDFFWKTHTSSTYLKILLKVLEPFPGELDRFIFGGRLTHELPVFGN